MNGRSQLLLIAMLAMVGLWVADSGYRNLIEEPAQKRTKQIETLENKIRQAREEIVENAGASDQLDDLLRLSLPYDPELARARYQDWLLDLVQSVDLSSTSVDAGKPVSVSVKDRTSRQQEEIFLRYSFALRGRGTLQQVARFLRHFYQAGHLHKISSMTMNPVAGGRQVDFTASIEALGLSRCERKEELSGVSVQRLAASDFSRYQTIARRNLFARHGDSILTETVLSAITIASNGTAQAWFAVGNGETQRLTRGEQLKLKDHTIEVIDIVAGQVLLDVDGEVITLTAGESIEAPPEDEGAEMSADTEAV